MNLIYVSNYGIRYLDYDNTADKSGRTEVLLLLHGIGASAERWLRVIPQLSGHFRVIVPDIIGFGYSDKPTVEYTIDFFVDFVDNFLTNLGVETLNIIGSSFGGYLAAEFASRFQGKVKRLVLAAPAGIMRSSTRVLDQYIMAALYPTYENAMGAFIEMAYDPSTVSEDTIKDFINRMRLPNSKYAFMSTLLGMRDSPDLAGRLTRVDIPKLFIWGETDQMIPLQYASELNGVPNHRLAIIKYCGHTPYVERPTEFNDIVLEFLGRGAKTNNIK
jgi:2-hydroxy-6-oxonona-2,4-dienedioate hydrolase